jgi:hypothetical protein
MKYAVLVYETQADFAERAHPTNGPKYMGSHFAYAQSLQTAGVSAGGAGLQPPSTATTVRIRNGARSVQDGPFADSKEQVGGFYLIDVPDLDAAIAWAAKCPNASRSGVEIRPLLAPPPGIG